MKLNFKYLTMMALALTVGFSSCSSDDAGTPDIIEGQPASLNLTLIDNGSDNAITTYAPGDGKPTGVTEGADASESSITAANQHIYIFDATGKLECYEKTLTGIIITSGAKKIYLIANVVAPVFTTFNATVGNAAATEANLLAEKFTLATPAIGDLTTANNFYISNVGGPGAANIAPGINNMNLSIGRGVAKINIDMTNATNPATGTLSGSEYLIANNPADMFFVPRYTSGQLQTPFFTLPTGASAYFNNGTVTPTTITAGLKTANGDKLNMSYATENAIAAAHISYSTINYAIIRSIFVPSAVVDVANVATTYPAGANFYRIQYIETVGTATHDRGYYPAFIAGGAPTAASPVYIAATAVGTIPTPAHGGTVVASISTYAGTGTGVGALCYYHLGLGDSRIATGGWETERFTVERNKYYYYEIASVADCGASTPVPQITVPPIASTLNINFVTGPWGVVGGSGGLTPGI